MTFVWNRKKAAANLKKHKVSFDEASTVFSDPLAMIFADEAHSDAEGREIIIGHSVLDRLLLVCFTERKVNVIRLISARRVSRRERRDYEENTRLP